MPEVTPQAIDDAIETIRKRTDALGVSEPEIQRAGQNQISIGHRTWLRPPSVIWESICRPTG